MNQVNNAGFGVTAGLVDAGIRKDLRLDAVPVGKAS